MANWPAPSMPNRLPPSSRACNRHFTDGTVESQFEPLFPIEEEERFCFLDLSLFGAKTQFVAS